MNYERIERVRNRLEAFDFCDCDDNQQLITEADDSLRLLLDVARAAERLIPPVAMTPETLAAQKALTALKEHCG